MSSIQGLGEALKDDTAAKIPAGFAAPGFVADPAQGMAISRLERLYQDLLRRPTPTRSRGLLGWLQKPKPPEPVLGIYMWGGVGRGKTWLMDTFFDSLPGTRKMRSHFHRFMHRIHDELQELSGQSDPLKLVASKLASETDIICFDEFFVSDITDAMLLGTLFQELFGHGVLLVATSNIPPHDLYRNGLQRARFLPAIELIERHCEVLNVDGGIDYRLRTLEQAEIYHCPLDLQAKANLDHYFQQLTGGHTACEGTFEVNHRQLTSLGMGEGVLIWSLSNFAVLPAPRTIISSWPDCSIPFCWPMCSQWVQARMTRLVASLPWLMSFTNGTSNSSCRRRFP